MSPQEEIELHKFNERAREELGKTNHVLAQTVRNMSAQVDSIQKDSRVAAIERAEMKEDLSKIMRVLIGDPQFQSRGVIQHGKEMELKAELLTVRVEKLEQAKTYLLGAWAAITIGVVAVWETVKEFFHGK